MCVGKTGSSVTFPHLPWLVRPLCRISLMGVFETFGHEEKVRWVDAADQRWMGSGEDVGGLVSPWTLFCVCVCVMTKLLFWHTVRLFM